MAGVRVSPEWITAVQIMSVIPPTKMMMATILVGISIGEIRRIETQIGAGSAQTRPPVVE